MSTRMKRALGVGIAASVLLGLLMMYQSLAAGWQVDKVRQLAEEARNLPKDQAKQAFSKVWAEAKKLSPEQRRELFEEGSRARLKEYFKLSTAQRVAYLDGIIKRDQAREAARKKQASAKGKSVAKTGQAKGAGQGQGQGQGQGRGGPGRGNMSPEQRAAQRRDRLDKSSPNDRAMRGQLAADMRDRRKQLGLPARSGRGGWR